MRQEIRTVLIVALFISLSILAGCIGGIGESASTATDSPPTSTEGDLNTETPVSTDQNTETAEYRDFGLYNHVDSAQEMRVKLIEDPWEANETIHDQQYSLEPREIVDLSHLLSPEGFYQLIVWLNGEKKVHTDIDSQYDWAIGIWSDNAVTADNLQT